MFLKRIRTLALIAAAGLGVSACTYGDGGYGYSGVAANSAATRRVLSMAPPFAPVGGRIMTAGDFEADVVESDAFSPVPPRRRGPRVRQG